MSEGPLDEQRLEASVLEFRANHRGAPAMPSATIEDEDTLPTLVEAQVAPWIARLTLELPDGVVQHPLLLDTVQAEVGRQCAIDIDPSRIALSYTVHGGSFDEACDDSRDVCDALVGKLHLDHDAVSEHELIRADELPTWRILYGTVLNAVPSD